MIRRDLKKAWIGAMIGAGVVLAVYLGFSFYFMNHFYFKTTINDKSVGGKTVAKVEKMLLKEAEAYQLELKERDDKSEVITGEAIGLTYDLGNQVEVMKKAQNPFGWLAHVWQKKALAVQLEPHYDEALLKENFNDLECFLTVNSVAPIDAKVIFKEGCYEIEKQQQGSFIKREVLYQLLEEAVGAQVAVLDLEAEKCYETPQYTVESEELIAERDRLNHYVSSKITYNFGDRTEVLDGDIIKEWVKEDATHQVTLDEEAVRAYVKQLAEKYNTLYGTRQFVTSLGKTVTVVGGDYGWRINKEEEVKVLLELLNTGSQEVTRTPVYEQEAWCRDSYDIGNSYVEVNLTTQYLWLYIEGKLIAQGSIVSGTGSNSYATPEGTYCIDYLERNATLRGPGYVTPVTYWMPFNSGIGIHDATWRSSFGGTIYMYSGSHGCINAPYELAQTVFEHVKAGMPVVCYKED